MIVELDQQDDVLVLRFKGRLAGNLDREYLVAKWEEIKKRRCAKVLLDFREVPSIASMGIGCKSRFTLPLRTLAGASCS